MTFAAHLRKALWIDWLILSALALLVLLAPFVLPARTVFAAAPVCQWKAKYNRECPLCGMTRSFVAISQGEFGLAERRNRGSVPLYAALLCNECLAVGVVAAQAGRRRRSACKR